MFVLELGRKRQTDEGEEHPKVLLSVLDIVPHPHHQSFKDGLLIGDIDFIAGEQLNYLSRGEQQELLVLNDLQEVFLEGRGDRPRSNRKDTLIKTQLAPLTNQRTDFVDAHSSRCSLLE
ncbi:hypothetical protein EYF80_007842 [Liparis tanakae]|uniref:Uncharacterized protein n=1 Tax=Liparis tanakae TaxID=230148 RepID=A0A4Z2IWK6_9TELE|nr:hypothetical protein EYF80_007842 [Liparis tanakae]